MTTDQPRPPAPSRLEQRLARTIAIDVLRVVSHPASTVMPASTLRVDLIHPDVAGAGRHDHH